MTSFLPIDQQLELDKLINLLNVLRKALDSPHCTLMQVIILLTVFKEEPISFKELKHKYLIAGATLTRACDFFKAKSIISKIKNPEDERLVILSMTDYGRDLLNKFLCDGFGSVIEGGSGLVGF